MLTRSYIIKDFLRTNRKLVGITVIALILSSLLTVLVPVSIGKYYDMVFGFSSVRARIYDLVGISYWDTIPSFLAFFFALVLTYIGASFLSTYLTGLLGERLTRSLRDALFAHQLVIDQGIYDNKGIGKYLMRYSGDLRNIHNYMARGIIRFIGDLILITAVSFVIFMLDLNFGLVFVATLALIWGIVTFMNRFYAVAAEERRGNTSGLLSFVNKRLRTLMTIKSGNLADEELDRFKRRSDSLYDVGIQFHLIRSAIFVIIPGILYALLGGLLVFIYLQKESGITLGQNGSLILVPVLLIITILPIFGRLLRVGMVWKRGVISLDKYISVMNLAEEPNIGKAEFEFKEGGIECKNLELEFYGRELLGGLSFNAKPGRITMVHGPTGSGKTSLIKLMLGLYIPTKGKILVDGQDIKDVDPKSLKRKIAVIALDAPLMGTTVFEAISYSRKESKRKRTQEVLDEVQAGMQPDLRVELDDKIGELGVRLSEGQVKTLGYVRAFLTRKPILLIDDPYSAFDDAMIKHVSKLIEKYNKQATILLFSNTMIENVKLDQVIEI
jgi:ABC-type multidrug transport system fused ATPase/permease subunit